MKNCFYLTKFIRHEESFHSFQPVKDEVPFLELTLKLDRHSRIVIERIYKSYFDVLILMGGLAKFLQILFTYGFWPIRKVLSYEELINDGFHVCLDKLQIKAAMTILMLGSKKSSDSLNAREGDELDYREEFNKKLFKKQGSGKKMGIIGHLEKETRLNK